MPYGAIARYAGGRIARYAASRIQRAYRSYRSGRARRSFQMSRRRRGRVGKSSIRRIRTGRLFRSVRSLFPVRGRLVRFVTCAGQQGPYSAAGGVFTDTMAYLANNCVDPEGVWGANQPFGYDQLCSATGVYNRYKVSKCTVDFKIVSAVNAASRVAMYHFIYPSNGLLGDPTTYEEACEWARDGRGKGLLIPPLPVGAPDTRIYRLSMSKTTKRMLPYTNPTDLVAAYNAAPAGQWTINVRVFKTSGLGFAVAETCLMSYNGAITQMTQLSNDVQPSS